MSTVYEVVDYNYLDPVTVSLHASEDGATTWANEYIKTNRPNSTLGDEIRIEPRELLP